MQANANPKHAAQMHMDTYHGPPRPPISEILCSYQTEENKATINILYFRMSSEGQDKMGRLPQEYEKNRNT